MQDVQGSDSVGRTLSLRYRFATSRLADSTYGYTYVRWTYKDHLRGIVRSILVSCTERRRASPTHRASGPLVLGHPVLR